jgi:ComF family protein
MRTVFIHLCDWIFPPSADLKVVRSTSPGDIAYLFTEQKVNNVISLSDFHDPTVRALIHEAKFHGNKKAFSLLAELFLMHVEYRHPIYDLVIPIPLSRARRRSRGYNQVSEVLRLAMREMSLPFEEKPLVRVRNTRPQTDLAKHERLTNLHGAFRVTDPARVAGKRILIVDDVSTTGATLQAAHAACVPYEPKAVTLLALAH